MTAKELLTALKRQEVMDSLRCLGCGYEHRCSVRGCAINRAAAEMIEKLAAENEALRNPPNSPLTLDELREMDGEPVWVVELNDYPSHWGLVYWCLKNKSNFVYVTGNNGASIYAETFIAAGGKIYRRKPEEGTV